MKQTAVTNSAKDGENDEKRDYEQCGCQIGCGICKIGRHPISCLNIFNNTKWALVFLSIGAFLQGASVNGISNVVISTLERRFHLRSSETGFISSSYEIGVCISIPIVAYIGGRGHKALWIGWGMFIMGVGCIIITIPHFIIARYVIPDAGTSVCNSTISDCDTVELRSMQAVFIVGQILLGVGASPTYTVALNYLDENVKEVYSSTYHGIYFAFALLGPGAGYLLGGYFLSLFVNLNEQVSITGESIFWIGNWWIGFLVCGILMIIFCIPVLMYPKQIPFTDKVRENREREMHKQRDALAIRGDKNFGKSIRDFPRCLLVVVKNPTIMLISVSGAMDSGIISALSAFGTKYIEAMFNLTSARAAVYFGIAVVVSGCSGNIVSGILITKLKMTVPRMMKLCIISTACSLGCLFIYLIYCPTPDVAGVNVPYNGNVDISCRSTCDGCSTDFFNPVCGNDGTTYTSFCDAGCELRNDETFENCSRVMMHPNVTGLENSTAILGKCEGEGCLSVGLFLTFGGLSVFFGYLKVQPGLQVSLRSIPFYQRSFALGVQWLIMRVVGQIPLPIILGKILDLSCIVWGEECGQCGACKLYDSPSMSRSLTSLCATLKVVSLICLVVTWKVYKPAEDISKPSENGERQGHESEETSNYHDNQGYDGQNDDITNSKNESAIPKA